MRHKILAYISRRNNESITLIVFEGHRDVQVKDRNETEEGEIRKGNPNTS